MKKRILSCLLIIIALCACSFGAFADRINIKPVDDPWDNPDNLTADGGVYYTHGDAGYIVVWETPECNVDGKYLLINNNSELTVENRITYMDNVPWGTVSIETKIDENGEMQYFKGWVLMSELVDAAGNPVIILPAEIPEHPVIPNPVVTQEPVPEVTQEPENEQIRTPSRPDAAITVSTTYNNAIVYTSVAIAVVALALVAYVLIKHKALNKKGE